MRQKCMLASENQGLELTGSGNKESRFPAPKRRKAASRDGINYKKESRFPAPKRRKAASLDGIEYKFENQ